MTTSDRRAVDGGLGDVAGVVDRDAIEAQPIEYAVVNGWLVEMVNHHTCGTGRDGYYGAHEPGCGMEPIATVDDLLTAEAKVSRLGQQLREAEAWLDRADPYPERNGDMFAELRAILAKGRAT